MITQGFNNLMLNSNSIGNVDKFNPARVDFRLKYFSPEIQTSLIFNVGYKNGI